MLLDNWLSYIIMGVVMLHLLIGFIWVIFKLSGRSAKKSFNSPGIGMKDQFEETNSSN